MGLSCLARAIYYTPDIFWGAKTPIQFRQKGITQTIYTDSEPPSQTLNSLMPSAKLRSANPIFLHLWCDMVGDQTLASCTKSGRPIHCATQGQLSVQSNLSHDPFPMAWYWVVQAFPITEMTQRLSTMSSSKFVLGCCEFWQGNCSLMM